MRNLLGHAFAYSAAAVAQKGLGFVLFIWLAAALSVENYAQFGLFFALQTGIAALVGAGTIESVVGQLRHAPDDAERRRVLSAANGVFVLLLGTALLLLVVLSGWLRRETGATATEIWLLAAIGALSGFYVLQAQLVRLNELHLASLVLNNAPMFAAFLGGFVGFLIDGTVRSFFVGMALGLACSLPAFARLYTGLAHAFAERRLVAGIARRIFPFLVIAIIGWLTGYGSTYLINSFFDVADVSRFTFAFTISSVMQLVATSLNQVWSPRFFRIVHDTPHAEVERQSRRFFVVQGLILGAVGGGILLLLPAALELAGDRLQAYTGLSAALACLLAGYAVLIPWYHAHNYFLVHSRGTDLMVLTVTASAAGLVLWFVAIWFLGPLGAYLGFTIQMLARCVAIVTRARRDWHILLHWEGPAIALLLIGLGAVVGELLRGAFFP